MSADTPMGSPALDSGTEDGIRWVTLQAPFYGAVNGYALLPQGHLWRQLSLQSEDYDAVDVHGGITYGPDNDGWIGFDFMHSSDWWPGQAGVPVPRYPDAVERTSADVVEEARNLARSIAAAWRAEVDAR